MLIKLYGVWLVVKGYVAPGIGDWSSSRQFGKVVDTVSAYPKLR